MSDVHLPNGYSGKARNLFKNLKDKNALSIADETSAPTMDDYTGSRSIRECTSNLAARL